MPIALLALVGGCSDGGARRDAATADGAVADLAGVVDQRPVADQRPVDGGAETIAELCSRQAAIICAGVVDCCAAVAPAAADAEACARAVERACVDQGAKEEQALAAGQVRIDGPGLAACEKVATTATAACRLGTRADELETCSNVIFATAEVGQSCAPTLGGARCADGEGVCFAEPTGVPCKAWAGQGVACSVAPCAPGLLCVPDVDPARPSICDARRGAGEPCVASAYCEAGLACFDKACGPALAEGRPCSDSAGKCAPGLHCSPLTETCAPQQGREGPCYIGSHCAAGLACDGVGTGEVCLPGGPDDGEDTPGLPSLGQPCAGTCARGLVCRTGPLAGRCIPALCAAVLAALR